VSGGSTEYHSECPSCHYRLMNVVRFDSPLSIFKFVLYEYFVGNVARMGEKLMKQNVVKEYTISSLLRWPMLRYGIILQRMIS